MVLWSSFTVMCWYLPVLSTISGYSRDIEYKLKQTFQNQCKLVQCRYHIALSIALYCICHTLRLNVISHCCWPGCHHLAGHQSWREISAAAYCSLTKFCKTRQENAQKVPTHKQETQTHAASEAVPEKILFKTPICKGP